MIGQHSQQDRGNGCAVYMRSRSNFATRCVSFSVGCFLASERWLRYGILQPCIEGLPVPCGCRPAEVYLHGV